MEQPQPTTEAAGGASDVERVVRPIEAGTEIEYCGQRATVWHDDGSDRIEVECEGSWQKWWWEFEGAECRIVRPNDQAQARAEAGEARCSESPGA